jgi:hypothetical protein
VENLVSGMVTRTTISLQLMEELSCVLHGAPLQVCVCVCVCVCVRARACAQNEILPQTSGLCASYAHHEPTSRTAVLLTDCCLAHGLMPLCLAHQLMRLTS